MVVISVFSSIRSHQTRGQKVPSKDRAGEPGQHHHVQEAPLPRGNQISLCGIVDTLYKINLLFGNLIQSLACCRCRSVQCSKR